MDLLWEGMLPDLFADLGQELAIHRVQSEVAQFREEHERLVEDNFHSSKELREENLQLKLRLGLLVRLLILKGVISAEEYAKLIADFQPSETKVAAPIT